MAHSRMRISVIFFAAHVLQKFTVSACLASKQPGKTMQAVGKPCAHPTHSPRILKLPLRRQNARRGEEGGGPHRLTFGEFRC